MVQGERKPSWPALYTDAKNGIAKKSPEIISFRASPVWKSGREQSQRGKVLIGKATCTQPVEFISFVASSAVKKGGVIHFSASSPALHRRTTPVIDK